MAATIFGTRFSGKREPAWHQLGTVFNDSPTAVEAVTRSGLDYQIMKVPMTIPSPWGDLAQGERVAIVREPTTDDPTAKILGYAGSNYAILQNVEIAQMVDLLTDEYPVETVGALGDGETMFITLTAGDGEIAGEQISRYFGVSDTRDGGSSFKMFYTPIRVVCANTLAMGLREAAVSASLGHTGQLKADVQFRLELMSKMKRAQDRVDALLGRLSMTTIVDDQVNSIIRAAYPDITKPRRVRLVEELVAEGEGLESLLGANPTLARGYGASQFDYDTARERVAALRRETRTLYQRFNDEHPKVAETPWAAYNAVVEMEDYRVTYAGDRWEKAAAAEALFGSRVKTKVRAFEAASSFCQN